MFIKIVWQEISRQENFSLFGGRRNDTEICAALRIKETLMKFCDLASNKRLS